jgi:hypothetical protein
MKKMSVVAVILGFKCQVSSRPVATRDGSEIMTKRFDEEMALHGRDWSKNENEYGSIGFLYEQIAPDDSVVVSKLVSPELRKQITEEFLASDSPNSIVFYPIFEEEIPRSYIEGLSDQD